VPIIFALVLGGITINNQVQRSDNYNRIDRLVTLSSDVRTMLDALQRERTQTVNLLTQGTVGNLPALDSARAATDNAAKPFGTDAARAGQLDASVIAPDVAAGTQSLIEEQVRNGVAVRMALLYLLAGVRPA